METCEYCLRTSDKVKGQFWFLNNYFGISGLFCTNCYDKVAHNSHAEPINPNEYLMILLKQESRNGKET